MSQNYRNRKKSGNQGGRIAALAILAIVALAVLGYLLFRPGTPKTPAGPRTATLPAAPAARQPSTPPVVHNYSAPEQHPHPEAHPSRPAAVTPDRPVVDRNGTARSGRLAIIIDDMGTSVQEARTLSAIGVPLTFSIIPGLRSYREVAAFADAQGLETMIHIPMQSKGWPERRLEPNGLLLSMSDAAVGERLGEFMQSLPRAVGANNHMGSEFTEHEEGMRAVLKALKGKGLYFVDSVTSPQTVGLRLARELGLKTARRNVFLDNEQDGAYIRGQLDQAVRLARKSGSAIAICHPHPVTIKTLEAALPQLAGQGITLVPASQLVR